MKCVPGTTIFAHEAEEFVVKVLAPTEIDQIPVSQINPVTGTFEYGVRTNALKNISIADAGKGVVVAQDGLTLDAVDVVQTNDAIERFFNQTGVLGDTNITILNSNTIRISAFSVNFFDQAANMRNVVSIPQTDLIITKAGSGVPADDTTYILLDSAGNFLQVNAPPNLSQQLQQLYVCEVSHPEGGAIEAVRPLYTIFSDIVARLRELSEVIGLTDRGFFFTFNRGTGRVQQTGAGAVVIGYNIAATGNDRNKVNFPVQDITVEYFSFNPADRVATLTDFRRTYNVDDPDAGTSAPIIGNARGIIVIYASVSGKYVVMAPQVAFTNVDEANARRVAYVGSIKLPDQFADLYVPVATVVVEGTVTSGSTTDFILETIGEIGFNGGSFAGQRTLPDPSTGNAGDIVVVNAAQDAYELKADISPDLSSAPAGAFLTVNGGALTTTQITSSAVTAGLFTGFVSMKVTKFDVVSGAVQNGSGDFVDISSNIESISGDTISVREEAGINFIFAYGLRSGEIYPAIPGGSFLNFNRDVKLNDAVVVTVLLLYVKN